ncbi:hypothetical protein [Kribbella italica]|uniref:Uncharacterized protein n=1 Tax=Kribbella italica TaxID=1540520 RepID=A0A7W9MRU1_9ACTN|nr:hypothetical protein [Kribbella italica]MBB5833370.1 hypothetical protein [Kribbella italica]
MGREQGRDEHARVGPCAFRPNIGYSTKQGWAPEVDYLLLLAPNLTPPSPLPGSTRAGTRLRFGAKAVITIGRADRPTRVGVIVTGVNKASDEDMNFLRGAYPDQVSRSAYLIRVVLVNEDGDKGDSAFSGYSGPNLTGDLHGGDAGAFRLLGGNLELPSCTDYSSPPAGWIAPGSRFQTCRVIFADPDQVRLSLSTQGNLYWK